MYINCYTPVWHRVSGVNNFVGKFQCLLTPIMRTSFIFSFYIFKLDRLKVII